MLLPDIRIPDSKAGKRFLLPLTLLFALLYCSPAITVAQTSEQPSDAKIANALNKALRADPGVSSNNITVEVSEGIATLKGDVNNMLAKERAVRIAETIRGVLSIIDWIEVVPAQRPDEETAAAIRSTLKANPRLDAQEIKVSVNQGKAELTGEVQSWPEKRLASLIAMSVKGIREVDNKINITYPDQRSDTEIREDIVSTLRWDRFVDDSRIKVAVDNSQVTLTGQVNSLAEKRLARSDAWVIGVTAVDAEALEVAPGQRDEQMRRYKYSDKADPEIQAAIEKALRKNSRIPELDLKDITVTITNGNVTLRGSVSNLNAKQAAEQTAFHTVGVWEVDNQLRVGATQPTEAQQLIEDVRKALAWNPYVQTDEITVSLNDGVVTLDGEVKTHWERARAQETAAQVPGIVAVDNRLAVSTDRPLTYSPYVDDYSFFDNSPNPTAQVSDETIAENIRDELWWSPFVDSDGITVAVYQGVATLSGAVDTWAESNIAEENAREGGAVQVINELDIRYGPTPESAGKTGE